MVLNFILDMVLCQGEIYMYTYLTLVTKIEYHIIGFFDLTRFLCSFHIMTLLKVCVFTTPINVVNPMLL